MARDIDLTSQEWRDLIFEGKNKKYGAYYLRKTSNKRHIRAMLIALALAVVVLTLPTLIESVTPKEKEVEVELGATELSKIDQRKDIPEEKIIEQPKAPPPPVLRATIQYVPPKAVKREEIKEEVEIPTNEEIFKKNEDVGKKTVEGTKDGKHVDDIPQIAVEQPKKPEPPVIFKAAEQPPTFPGGNAELMKYLGNNLKYPPAAAEEGISGRVVVQFVVNKTGAISDVKIIQKLHPSCDREAERLVKNMPNWIPGRQSGNAVNVYFTLPIRFVLKEG